MRGELAIAVLVASVLWVWPHPDGDGPGFAQAPIAASSPDPASFDHENTAMPLVGAHRNVACAKCHPNNVFSLGGPKPGACDNAGCHLNAHTGHLFGVR